MTPGNPTPSPDHVRLALPSAEAIANLSILQLAASHWEEERFAAFADIYQGMRRVDDLVDRARADGQLDRPARCEQIRAEVRERMAADRDLEQLRRRFHLPERPWRDWTAAMLRDCEQDGFSSRREFRRYAEGAAVAPGEIFLHLCTVRRDGGDFLPPEFDCRRPARDLGLFCYLVHVIRDFQVDQRDGLHYLTGDLLARHQLDNDDLDRAARSETTRGDFAGLVDYYRRWAQRSRERAGRLLAPVIARLEPRYALSMQVVITLYDQQWERLKLVHAPADLPRLVVTADERHERLEQVWREFAGR